MYAPGTLHLGTSGWYYRHWKGPFFPAALPASQYLPYYAKRLRSAEINNTFYQLPEYETLHAWRDAVPEDLVFAVKASRYITHLKKRKDPQEPLQRLYERLEVLADKRGPILFQLPPNWHLNAQRLEIFLEALSTAHRHAFEFRDVSWLDARSYDLLATHGAAFCIYELAGYVSPHVVTADFVYVRLYGPGEAYQGSYDAIALHDWAEVLSTWRRQGRDVYCYFDNDQAGFAAHNALALAALTSSGGAKPQASSGRLERCKKSERTDKLL